MAAQIRFLVLLLVSALFTSSFADFVDVEDEGIAYSKRTTNISSMVDTLLPTIREFILQQSMDPMKLDDLSEKLPGVIIHDRVIHLMNGRLQGLSDIRRAGDALLISDDGAMSVEMVLGFDVLDGNFDYLLKDFFIARRGQMNGRFVNVELRAVADVSLKDRKVVLRTINILRVDKLSITFKGHAIDPLLNAIIKRVTNCFRDAILRVVEDKMVVIAQQYINKLVENLPLSNEFLMTNDVLEYIPTTVNFVPSD